MIGRLQQAKKTQCVLACCIAWWAISSPAVAQTSDQAAVESQLGKPPGTVIKVRGLIRPGSENEEQCENAARRILVQTVDGQAVVQEPRLRILGSNDELSRQIALADDQFITVDCVEILRPNGANVDHILLAIESLDFDNVDDEPDRDAMPSVLGVPYGVTCHIEGELVLPNPDLYRARKWGESLMRRRWIRVKKVNGCAKKILTELELTSYVAGVHGRGGDSEGEALSLIGYERIAMRGLVSLPRKYRDLVDLDAWRRRVRQDTGWRISREFVVTGVLDANGADEQAPTCTAPPLLLKPFGSVCPVEARVVKAEYREGSEDPRDFECVLEIHSVAGKKLPKPATFSARLDWSMPTSQEIDELRSRTGSMVALVGYETMWMRGGPIGCVAGPADGAGKEDARRWQIERGFRILPWLPGKGGPPLVEKR